MDVEIPDIADYEKDAVGRATALAAEQLKKAMVLAQSVFHDQNPETVAVCLQAIVANYAAERESKTWIGMA